MASDSSSSEDEDLYGDGEESAALFERLTCARKVLRAAHDAGPEGVALLAKFDTVLRDAIHTAEGRRLKRNSAGLQTLLALAGAHDLFIIAGFMPNKTDLVLADAALPEAQAMV